MTKFTKGQRVKIVSAKADFKKKYIGNEFEIANVDGYYDKDLNSYYNLGDDATGGWRWADSELELAKETKVTEFRAGDVVRLTRNGRNWYGAEYGYPKGKEFVLEAIYDELFNFNGPEPETDFTPWRVTDGGWVRSDDIELVSRKEEPLTVELTSEMIDWEDTLFGTHETENAGAEYKVSLVDNGIVSLKIKRDMWWRPEDLIELGSHLFALAEYLETGTVDLSDDCIECENEHLRDSNERLASANEAKRQRLAKIRELTEV